MALPAAFSAYLRERSIENTRALEAELGGAGYDLEAAALRNIRGAGPCWFVLDETHGPWAGRRCWTGPFPPQVAGVGDIWMDAVEITPMILTPGEEPDPLESYSPEALARFGPFHGWMALRPTANWQFSVFLEMAHFARRPVQVAPAVALFDRGRILRGPDTAPVTGVLADEAIQYANWFGKVLCGRYEWQALGRLLPAPLLAGAWLPLGREWACRFSEGVNAAASPETVDLDWVDEYDRGADLPDGERMFFGEWEAPRGITFRAAVRSDIGLLRQPVDDPLSPLDVQLTGLAPRSPWLLTS